MAALVEAEAHTRRVAVASVRRDIVIGPIDHGQDIRPRNNRGRTHRAGTAAAHRLGDCGSRIRRCKRHGHAYHGGLTGRFVR
jgi:hypothetical protein